ncbi:transposase-like protein [Bradyrhizobium ottawaense]
MPLLIGATPGPEGTHWLPGRRARQRASWHELLVEAKTGGLKIAPKIAVGDGALGLWKTLDEVFPATRHQPCWVHKTEYAIALQQLPGHRFVIEGEDGMAHE